MQEGSETMAGPFILRETTMPPGGGGDGSKAGRCASRLATLIAEGLFFGAYSLSVRNRPAPA